MRLCTENSRFAFLNDNVGATYDDHLIRLIGKFVVDFLLVLIELFSLSASAKALLANIGSSRRFRFNWGRLTEIFR